MALTADRCKETSTTTGTGTLTLAGAVSQFRAFQDCFSVGDQVYYAIEGQTGTEWEVGIGTLATTTTLSRDTILASSNSGNAVNLSAGTKNVFCTIPSSHINGSQLGMELVANRGWAMP